MWSNLDLMRRRLEFQGGIEQDKRMINDKYRTFLRTLKYSYQACDVMMVQERDKCLVDGELPIVRPQFRALINPNKNKADYDEKVLSIDYKSGYKSGDVIQWIGTKSNWIIYLPELTEDAYYRSAIRRCDFMLKFKDNPTDDRIYSTWASIRGPIETQIDSIQKNSVRIDRPNLSLNIFVPKNDLTIRAFDRYKEFIFKDKCWRVEAPNIVTPYGVLEIYAEEYYIDKDTDNDIKNGLIVEPIDPTPDTPIQGETFIKPLIPVQFIAPNGEGGGTWSIVEKCAKDLIDLRVLNNKTTVEIVWTKSTSGQFTLKWIGKDGSEATKVVVVESLM